MAKKKGRLPDRKQLQGRTYYPFVAVKYQFEAREQLERLRRNNYLALAVYGDNIIGIYSHPKTPNWYSGLFLRERKGK